MIDIYQFQSLLDNITEIYEFSSVGGALHTVLEDGNTDDESIEYCLETCQDHWSLTGCAPENKSGYIDLIKKVGRQLLTLSKEQRDIIIRAYNE